MGLSYIIKLSTLPNNISSPSRLTNVVVAVVAVVVVAVAAG
jgi:hypothetical protein